MPQTDAGANEGSRHNQHASRSLVYGYPSSWGLEHRVRSQTRQSDTKCIRGASVHIIGQAGMPSQPSSGSRHPVLASGYLRAETLLPRPAAVALYLLLRPLAEHPHCSFSAFSCLIADLRLVPQALLKRLLSAPTPSYAFLRPLPCWATHPHWLLWRARLRLRHHLRPWPCSSFGAYRCAAALTASLLRSRAQRR